MARTTTEHPSLRWYATASAFPRLPLYSAIVLVLFSIGAVTFGRVTEIGTLRVAHTSPIAVRDLRFTELAGSELLVSDAASGDTIAVLRADEDGFVRGTLRGLSQERKVRRVNLDAPYRLILWETGRLTISDTETGERFPLDAFGKTNSAAFQRFLDKESGL